MKARPCAINAASVPFFRPRRLQYLVNPFSKSNTVLVQLLFGKFGKNTIFGEVCISMDKVGFSPELTGRKTISIKIHIPGNAFSAEPDIDEYSKLQKVGNL